MGSKKKFVPHCSEEQCGTKGQEVLMSLPTGE